MRVQRIIALALGLGLGVSHGFAQPGLAPSQPVPIASEPAMNSQGTGMPLSVEPAFDTPYSGGFPEVSTLPPGPTQVLTAPPMSYPQQAVPFSTPVSNQLWCGDKIAGADCCGPIGANGPIVYDLYFRTGPSFIVGGGSEFAGAVGFGWTVGGGGRTLFLNPERTAAWALDLGVSFAYNDGEESRVIDVFTPAPPFFDETNNQNPLNGMVITPDQLNPFRIRGLYRTSFNYAIGRDWFLDGPEFSGSPFRNRRLGIDIGGRWGNTHADLVPVGDPDNFLRRNVVYHGIFVGANYSWELPMGAWTLFGGGRAEYGYDYTNVIPPRDGNIQDIRVQLMGGVRF